jgi:predicted N-acetyltransferase YhbS
VIALVPLAQVSPQAVDSLLDKAFGENRRARTAYRVRAGTDAIDALSFAALGSDGTLLGTIQCWPVLLRCDRGATVALVMVGPVAVEPSAQRDGIGRALMTRALEAASDSAIDGAKALMLIGDPEYYGRFFGFAADRTGRWRLPGPFEAHRLLTLGDAVPDCAGELGPRILQPA